jgi:hypothetical protein
VPARVQEEGSQPLAELRARGLPAGARTHEVASELADRRGIAAKTESYEVYDSLLERLQ